MRDRVCIAHVSSQALLGIRTRRIAVLLFFHGERTPPGKSLGSQLWAHSSLMSGSRGPPRAITGCRHAEMPQVRARSRCPGWTTEVCTFWLGFPTCSSPRPACYLATKPPAVLRNPQTLLVWKWPQANSRRSRFIKKGHRRCLWPESYGKIGKEKQNGALETVRMRMPSLIVVRSEVHFLTGLEGPRMVESSFIHSIWGERLLKKAPPGSAKRPCGK